MGYSVWKNSITQNTYRVSDNGDNRCQLLSQQIIDVSLFFAGQSSVALADTSQLRAWLESFHTV